MSNIVNNIDMTAAAAGLSKTSPNNQAIAGQAHTLKMVTYANASAALDNISPNLSLPVIPAPLGTKTPDETQVVAEKLASKLAPFVTKHKSAEERIADPDVQATLAGQAPSIAQQQANISANASGSLELMLQMMALTSPSKAIKAMVQSMDAQQASVKSQSAKSIKNLEKYYKNQEAAKAKGQTAKIFGWIASIATLVIGALVFIANPLAGAMIFTAGAFLLANQIYQATASQKFKDSKAGKILGTTLTIGAAVASVVAAIATGGASAVAMGFAIVSSLGSVLTASLQVAETYSPAFQKFLKDNPDWAIAIMAIGPALSLIGGAGSGIAGLTGAANAAEEGATVAEDAGKLAKLANAVKNSKATQALTNSVKVQKGVNAASTVAGAGQSTATGTGAGYKISAAESTKTGQIAQSESQTIDADIQNIKAFQDQLNKSISSVTEFVNTLNTMVADLSQAQVQSFNQTSRLV